MSVNPKSVEFQQLHAKPHLICFFTAISKITKEIFAKICWQLKTPTRTWKCTRCIMQMSYLYASDFSFKTLATIWKICLGKEECRVLVVDKSTDHDKPYFDFDIFMFFFFTIWTSKKFFFQSASWKRHCATDWREQRGWELVTSYWFVLSMRMQVILDSSFARPGSAPTRGGKKGEFRDWTRPQLTRSGFHLRKRLTRS